MRWLLILILISPWSYSEGNLLSDPDFDNASSLDGVTSWKTFIEPGPTAYPTLSPISHSGEYSAHLFTSKKYDAEPYNNWSQIIRDVPEAERFWLSGSVRTEGDATASLWIQFFQYSPLKVLKADSVSADETHGWKRLRLSIKPPPSVDFIMIRCVIEGEGQAWFDSLIFSDQPKDHSMADDLTLLEDFDDFEVEPLPPRTEVIVDQSALDVIQAAEAMKEMVNRLAVENREVLSRLDRIQDDLVEFKRKTLTQAMEEVLLEPLEVVYSAHPLVPFGYERNGVKEN